MSEGKVRHMLGFDDTLMEKGIVSTEKARAICMGIAVRHPGLDVRITHEDKGFIGVHLDEAGDRMRPGVMVKYDTMTTERGLVKVHALLSAVERVAPTEVSCLSEIPYRKIRAAYYRALGVPFWKRLFVGCPV